MELRSKGKRTAPEKPVKAEKKVKKTVEKTEKKKVEKTVVASDEPGTSIKSPKSKVLKVGDTIPDTLSVQLHDGEVTKLSDLCKDNGIIIFFYPKANTPGCTTQACGFRDNFDAVKKAGYDIYGMSADSPKSQTSWKTKYNFQYSLLCDPSYDVLKVLGVFKAPKGIKRSHLVIEKGGKIVDAKIQISPSESVSQAVEFVTK